MTKTTTRTRNARMQKGTGIFACESCRRQTRETGHGAVGIKLCDECYDLAGIYNAFQDNGADDVRTHYSNDVRNLTAAIVAKGGTLDADALHLLEIVNTPAAPVVEAVPVAAEVETIRYSLTPAQARALAVKLAAMADACDAAGADSYAYVRGDATTFDDTACTLAFRVGA